MSQEISHPIADINAEQLEAEVIRALAKVAPESSEEVLEPKANFRDQIDFDSMDFVAFVLALEKALGVKVPEADYPMLSSLDGCRRYFSAEG